MFKKIGKDATEHFLQNVVGDGACGFRCIALHCCHNEADFKRIRRNINKFIIHHWELLELEKIYGNFEEGLTFNAGMGTQIFHLKIEFLCFLDSEKADLLWMDHLDLQMAANTYKINLNVLSVQSKIPTWTNISHSDILINHTCEVCKVITYNMELPKEMLMLHNGNHYQLFVPKNSPLAETLGYKPAKSYNITDEGEVSSPTAQGEAVPEQRTGRLEELQACQVTGRGEGPATEKLSQPDLVTAGSRQEPGRVKWATPEKYTSDIEEDDSESDQWETDDETEINHSEKI